jgi:hypothetical protein
MEKVKKPRLYGDMRYWIWVPSARIMRFYSLEESLKAGGNTLIRTLAIRWGYWLVLIPLKQSFSGFAKRGKASG